MKTTCPTCGSSVETETSGCTSYFVPSTTLTDTDNYEEEVTKVLESCLFYIEELESYGIAKNWSERQRLIDTIRARKMSINKKSAEIGWDAAVKFERQFQNSLKDSDVSAPDKQKFLSSLPETDNDKLSELTEWIKRKYPTRAITILQEILAKATEIQNK